MILRRISLLGNDGCKRPRYISPKAKILTYNGNLQELLTAGSTDNGTIYYSMDNSTWSENVPSRIDAGSYLVYWKLVGDEEYCDISSKINVIIEKADSSLSFAVTDITIKVGETASNIVTVNAGNGNVTYDSSNASVITVDNNGSITGVAAGYSVVTANISSTDNYNSASASYTSMCGVFVTAKFNIIDTGTLVRILSSTTNVSKIYIDGVELPDVPSLWAFTTKGEHIVKYGLIDQTTITEHTFSGCTRMESVNIPDTVTSIGNSAFQYCTGLTSVTIPDSVVSLGKWVFEYCYSLTSMVIPDSVTSIDTGLFYGCSGLTSVTLGSGITTISESICYSCTTLTSVNIPSGVTSIARTAFGHCSGLTSIDIPSGVTSIGEYAFQRCSGLTSIDIPDSVTSIGKDTFLACVSLTSCTIGSGITSIGEQAFTMSISLKSAVIKAVTPPTLGASAFTYTNDCPIYVPTCSLVDTYKSASVWSGYGSRITSLDCIPITAKFNVTSTSGPTRILSSTTNIATVYVDGVKQPSVTTGYTFNNTGEHIVGYVLFNTSISSNTFANCYNMKSIEIPSSITNIGSGMCYGCYNLTSITVDNGNEAYDSRNNCNAIINTNTNELIQGCNNTVMPNTVTSIGSGAFGGHITLTNIDIPNSVTSIGDSAFTNCSGAINCTIGSGVTSIGDSAFTNCYSITSIDIPDNVTSVGWSAFRNCSGMTSCTIGSGVTNIHAGAFMGCSGLTSIIVKPVSPPTINYDTFYNTNNCPIYVPSCGLINTYKSNWGEYSDRIDSLNCPKIIAKYNVTSTTEITPILYPYVSGGYNISDIYVDGVKQSSVSTGYTFDTLGEHTVEYSLEDPTYIERSTFACCYNITSVVIPDGVELIDELAFWYCTGMTSIVIPDSVKTIAHAAIQRCFSLTSVTIPSGVTFIGTYAFWESSGLTSITVEATTPPSGAASGAFADTNNCPIYVPTCSLVDTYKSASGWSDYSNRITALDCP